MLSAICVYNVSARRVPAVVIQVFDNVCVFSGDKWQVRLQPPKPAGFEAGQIHAPITRDVQYRPILPTITKILKIVSSDFFCVSFSPKEAGPGCLANPENTFEKNWARGGGLLFYRSNLRKNCFSTSQ